MSDFQIAEYCKAYPEAEIQDVFKYIFQSADGCEHLVGDYDLAKKRIEEELPDAKKDVLPSVELLPGDYCRIHLKALSEGLSAETLAKLFLLSAKKEKSKTERLQEGLREFTELVRRGEIRFCEKAVCEEISRWEQSGFPPRHHSDTFRQAYHPAYRVINKKFANILPLLTAIDKMQGEKVRIIAIDGPCASGKTTIATLLREIYDCNVFHMDDFFLQPSQRTPERLALPGENVDHERFLAEVLLPLAGKEQVCYRKFDCHSGKLCPSEQILLKRLNIVEGVYSLRADLKQFYDLCVFLRISSEKQKQRILLRNTEPMAQRFFSEWIPMEEKYFSAFRVCENADLRINMG